MQADGPPSTKRASPRGAGQKSHESTAWLHVSRVADAAERTLMASSKCLVTYNKSLYCSVSQTYLLLT